MKSIVLFAASRDQRKYFTALCEHLNCKCQVTWYKSLKVPFFFTRFPFSQLWQQAKLLTVRKQNSRKGRLYPGIVWPINTFMAFVQAIWLYALFFGWLRKLTEEHVGVWNGKKFRQAILLLAIKRIGKQPIFFETGPLPGVSAIDPKGVNFYSSIPNKVGFYQQRTKSELSESLIKTPSQLKSTGLPEHYILVPFQVVEDSNIYLHSRWIRNMRQLFAICAEISEQLDSNLTFVFKEHPACNESYEDLRKQQNEKLRFVDGVSTPELVEYADAIITVNSTVGIEGLIFGKKVFVLGDALFGINGISFPVSSQEMLLNNLQKLDSIEPDLSAIESFIDYLKNSYAIPGNAMQEPNDEHWKAADHRINLLISGRANQALGLNSNEHTDRFDGADE